MAVASPIEVVRQAAADQGVLQRELMHHLHREWREGHAAAIAAFDGGPSANPYEGIDSLKAAVWTMGFRQAQQENS